VVYLAEGVEVSSDAQPVPAGTRVDVGPSDDDIGRALERLSKARIRIRDVTSTKPRAVRPRVEAIERAHLALSAAEQVLEGRPDDAPVQKTHALAEIAEVLALRREGYTTRDEYLADVAPGFDDPALEQRYFDAQSELTAAQANWDTVKIELVGGESGPTIDLTGHEPVIDTCR
jgi:hypothetical protein